MRMAPAAVKWVLGVSAGLLEAGRGRGALEDLRGYLLREASRCIYCGFCEPVCPTLPPGRHRGYGPRGRVNIARMIALEGRATREDELSIYSCLLCGACNEVCPARIDIVGVVRAARALMAGGR